MNRRSRAQSTSLGARSTLPGHAEAADGNGRCRPSAAPATACSHARARAASAVCCHDMPAGGLTPTSRRRACTKTSAAAASRPKARRRVAPASIPYASSSASLVSSAAWVALRPMLNPARVASEALARPQRVTVAAATPDAARAPTPMATGALNTPAAPSAAVPTTPAADDACQRPVSVSPARKPKEATDSDVSNSQLAALLATGIVSRAAASAIVPAETDSRSVAPLEASETASCMVAAPRSREEDGCERSTCAVFQHSTRYR